MLLFNHKSEPFLNRIFAYDEKWIQYLISSVRWMSKIESSKNNPKCNINTSKKKKFITAGLFEKLKQ